MALNAAHVLVGTADQTNVTGAIHYGDTITEIPDTFAKADTLFSTLAGEGTYVSDEGMTMETDTSTEDIREWNHAVVRRVLDSNDVSFTFSLIQMDAAGLKLAIGEEYVTETPATTTHGAQTFVKMGMHLAPVRSWCIALKDGDTRVLIVVPKGQITTLDSISFNATEAVALPVTLSCYDDGTGNTCRIFIDDGQTTKSGS